MIQRLATLLITLYISISLQAQDKKKPGFTKEEFRARQEAYLTQKAEITQEEATKFFPIYFELQDRKKTVLEPGAQCEFHTQKRYQQS